MDSVDRSGVVIERRIVVVGAVQGIGYRWFAREAARTLGVSGWVRNMPDGTVVLEVAAEGQVLRRFAVALEAGPPGADVHRVQMTERPDSAPLPDGFLIVR